MLILLILTFFFGSNTSRLQTAWILSEKIVLKSTKSAKNCNLTITNQQFFRQGWLRNMWTIPYSGGSERCAKGTECPAHGPRHNVLEQHCRYGYYLETKVVTLWSWGVIQTLPFRKNCWFVINILQFLLLILLILI